MESRRLLGLITEAASEDALVREMARGELIALRAAAVGPLLDALWDDEAPVAWSEAAWLLRKIGLPALGPLADAIAAAPTPTALRRARWAFTGLDVPGLGVYASALKHPDPQVRQSAAYVFQGRGRDALSEAHLLLPLLADPVPEVREGAVWALREVGTGVVPLLRGVRRGLWPGYARARAGALEVLAAVGGPEALDERDRAALRRLISVKARDEIPEPMHTCGSWFAVPTTDQEAVLDAFGLSGAVPVTMRLGASAWCHDLHAGNGPRARHGTCSRVYVSPALDGWTLVFGTPSGDAHADDGRSRGARVRSRCAALSRRFGAAHWYGMRCGDDWTAWCLGEGGEVVRFYDVAEPESEVGGEHPAEARCVPHYRSGFPRRALEDLDAADAEAFLACFEEIGRELWLPGQRTAVEVAGQASVDPASIGPQTRVTGRAVLALTACGREHGHPRGALCV
ncbi:HEAT repeat domain-containing protein [Streptomyces specialis]|uniref:HEAT repeat domain-containing protein n=1 Tax=Streptomyces specialis TaxID=498367 RepID=UPI00073ED666|nr:HEAT repeat domain-containing protein [Streptomyces specialis]